MAESIQSVGQVTEILPGVPKIFKSGTRKFVTRLRSWTLIGVMVLPQFRWEIDGEFSSISVPRVLKKRRL